VKFGISQFRATAVLTDNWNAVRFITGNAPGKPMHTGHVCVFAGMPNFVLQLQNILLSVSS
jgi:hypothetical protein